MFEIPYGSKSDVGQRARLLLAPALQIHSAVCICSVALKQKLDISSVPSKITP